MPIAKLRPFSKAQKEWYLAQYQVAHDRGVIEGRTLAKAEWENVRKNDAAMLKEKREMTAAIANCVDGLSRIMASMNGQL